MTNLGLLYIQGLGVPEDYVLGYMWINLAAASGLAGAVSVRDALAQRMTPEQTNEAQKLAKQRWAKRIAAGGAPHP
jgi:TPR repeat protein